MHSFTYMYGCNDSNQLLNRNQACKDINRHNICLTDSDHDFILDEIRHRDTIEYQKYMSIDDKDDQFT